MAEKSAKKGSLMLFHRVLDETLAAWSHLAVLRALQDAAQGMSGRELARQAGLSHQACDRAVSRLEKLHILQRQRSGRAHFFTLNHNHRLVTEALLPLLAAERRFFPEFCKVIRKRFRKSTLAVILFGSVARKQENSSSDVDLCLIVRRAQDKSSVEVAAHQAGPVFFRLFGAKLAPILFTAGEFRKKARQNLPPVADILKDGVVISGQSLRELSRE